MATNLKIDEVLLDEAMKLGGFRTKREAVNEALREFVERHGKRKVLELVDNIEFDPSYDSKAQRNRA